MIYMESVFVLGVDYLIIVAQMAPISEFSIYSDLL